MSGNISTAEAFVPAWNLRERAGGLGIKLDGDRGFESRLQPHARGTLVGRVPSLQGGCCRFESDLGYHLMPRPERCGPSKP